MLQHKNTKKMNNNSQNIDIEALPNLASTLLGSKIIFSTDEWFASADRMIRGKFIL